MSGGSFDYLYTDMDMPDKLYTTADKLRRMKEYAEAVFPDAVLYIEDMLQLIERIDREYCEKGAEIKDLLRAIEWEASSDYTADQVHKVLADLKTPKIK